MRRVSTRSIRSMVVTALVASLLAALGANPAGSSPRDAAALAKRADFNGDGFTDLATGTPFSGLTATHDEGAVVVARGSQSGIVATGVKSWTLDTSGVPGAAHAADGFGAALASADFNRDGFADLAIGVPYREVGGATNAGEVVVLRGSAQGLTTNGVTVITENSAGVPGTAHPSDFFGHSLAPADFDGDGFPDLVVGAPLKEVQGVSRAGAVDVLYGGAGGLGSGGARMITRATPGVSGDPVDSAQFGFGLEAGNLGRGARPDLAVGAFADDVGGIDGAGTVTVLYSGPAGVRTSDSQRWTPTNLGLPAPADQAGGFGWALSIGDVGKSPEGDLAIGALGADVQGLDHAGAVYLLYGGPDGLTTAGSRRMTQATPGVPGDPAVFALFGATLATANFDRAGRGDLAIGARNLDAGAGGVFVMPGKATGVDPAHTALFSAMDLTGQTGSVQAAYSLTTGNFGRGAAPDLAVGAPEITTPEAHSAGGVSILFGRLGGLSAAHRQLVDEDSVPGFGTDLVNVGQTLVDSPYSPD
jgi:hypothetical protein